MILERDTSIGGPKISGSAKPIARLSTLEGERFIEFLTFFVSEPITLHCGFWERKYALDLGINVGRVSRV